MPTTITAGEVMDRSAALMNDPNKTDYTYAAQLIYLNMAIDELVEHLEESGSPTTNVTSAIVVVPAGTNQLSYDIAEGPVYPSNLLEVEQIKERLAGSGDNLVAMTKREFRETRVPEDRLLSWAWEESRIKFNVLGALTPRELLLTYIKTNITKAEDEDSIINLSNSISFLSYKTAALCARFIGENVTRADVLNGEAELALERMNAIQNKGKQQIMTRHRPFRASFKGRGGW